MVEVVQIESWFDWLMERYPTSDEPTLVIAPPEYDSLGDEDGNAVAFGVFIPQENRIVVLSNVPDVMKDEEERALFTSLAHEYRHHLQWLGGARVSEEFKEADAEEFADEVYEVYLNSPHEAHTATK